MKRNILLVAVLCMAVAVSAQNDSTGKNNSNNNGDTIHVGNMLIIKDGDQQASDDNSKSHHKNFYHRPYKPSNINTNWMIVDIGFANFNDKTHYMSPVNSGWFNLRNGKSVDVNIWLFMQRLNLIKHVVNLKYGLGIELNNYRYTSPILLTGNEADPVKYDSLRHYKKNKLAADYVTVPLMLNFNLTPHHYEGFGFSVGVSVGYLYSSRQKTITVENGKQKNHNNFDLEPWKISYIAELQLGPVKLYGSYATRSMFKSDFDQTPYNVGIRLSNW
jgi:hypothetical protein